MNTQNQDDMATFIDKCTARWLFEKTGVQLYTHAINKCPEEYKHLKAKFEEIRNQEHDHEEMLEDVIRECGAEPHNLTPSAEVVKIESKGIVEVVENCEFKDVICALLTAEMEDTANWEMLVMLCEKAGQTKFKTQFEMAMNEETEHVRFIRQTVLEDLLGEDYEQFVTTRSKVTNIRPRRVA